MLFEVCFEEEFSFIFRFLSLETGDRYYYCLHCLLFAFREALRELRFELEARQQGAFDRMGEGNFRISIYLEALVDSRLPGILGDGFCLGLWR